MAKTASDFGGTVHVGASVTTGVAVTAVTTHYYVKTSSSGVSDIVRQSDGMVMQSIGGDTTGGVASTRATAMEGTYPN